MGANPLAALNAINPSLVQYTGGFGKALQSLGGSMSNMGQAKLDLEKQAQDQKYRDDMYKLSLNADTRAADAVTRSEQDRFQTKNDKLSSNVMTNSFLLGQEAPIEMSNDYARLSMIDPTMVAAAAKQNDDKYSGTAGGIIYNTKTGAIAGDYRNPDSGSKELSGLPSVRSIVNGKERVTYFNPDGSVKLRINGDGTPIGVYSQYVADGIGDENVPQRKTLSKSTDENIEATNAIEKGGLPVRLSSDPRIAAKQKEYLYPTAGGGYYVPANLVKDYSRKFLAPPPPLK